MTDANSLNVCHLKRVTSPPLALGEVLITATSLGRQPSELDVERGSAFLWKSLHAGRLTKYLETAFRVDGRERGVKAIALSGVTQTGVTATAATSCLKRVAGGSRQGIAAT
jgi:hypothetical protein